MLDAPGETFVDVKHRGQGAGVLAFDQRSAQGLAAPGVDSRIQAGQAESPTTSEV